MHPWMGLRWMNEVGVFGRFVPDFGRVVAQMQFDMYHHYTVDDSLSRASFGTCIRIRSTSMPKVGLPGRSWP